MVLCKLIQVLFFSAPAHESISFLHSHSSGRECGIPANFSFFGWPVLNKY